MPISFEDISAKLDAGARLAEADARVLAAGSNIVSLGMLADEARRRRHGSRATFVRVADVAVAGRTDPIGRPAGAGEFRIVGVPASLGEATAAVQAARAAAGRTPVSGFSLADLEGLADQVGGALRPVLAALKDAGLEMVAEAPLDQMQAAEQSLEAAGEAGLPVARVTLHDALDPDWVMTCLRLAALQDALGSLKAFAPLSRHVSVSQPTTGYDDVKRVALARLLVDNIDTIQVDWTLYGPKLAQVALTFGADDLDAVPPGDDLSQGRRRAPLEEIRRSIQAAFLVPAERNGRFEILTS